MSKYDKLFGASIAEIKKGYNENSENYCCLICGERSDKGTIYKSVNGLVDAEKYMKVHVTQAHCSVFEYIVGLDKKVTGLSENQSNLLKLFYQGKNDTQVQNEMNIGSLSTIRTHRFALKEKEREAKAFLVLMELLKENNKNLLDTVIPHKSATMMDDRYDVSQEESSKILEKYFPDGTSGRLLNFNMKQKSKIVVLKELSQRFEAERIYAESEVNEILKTAQEDFTTLRRYLIEYGFLDRKRNCSQYWLINEIDAKEVKVMNSRKELVQKFKDIKIEAGVYQIRNTVNQKILIASTPNLKTLNGKRMALQIGTHMVKKLQEEITQFGPDAFVIEVLEVLDEKEDETFNIKLELKKLETKWLDKLTPYGDRGYNTEKPII